MTSVQYDHNGIYNVPKIIGYIPNQVELRKHGTSLNDRVTLRTVSSDKDILLYVPKTSRKQILICSLLTLNCSLRTPPRF